MMLDPVRPSGLFESATHENHDAVVQRGFRELLKAVANIKFRVSCIVGHDMHPGQPVIDRMFGKRVDQGGTNAAAAKACIDIDMQVTGIGPAKICKNSEIRDVVEKRIESRVFETAGEVAGKGAV